MTGLSLTNGHCDFLGIGTKRGYLFSALLNNLEIMPRTLSLADQIALELRADIIGGWLLPGMPLIELTIGSTTHLNDDS